jgi:hypothetical protein
MRLSELLELGESNHIVVDFDGVWYEVSGAYFSRGAIVLEVDPLDEIDQADTRSGDFV